MPQHARFWAAQAAALLLSVRALADNAPASADPDALCRSWFGPDAQVAQLALANTNAVVQEVTRDGRLSGWLFRTDQVPPACKGKRGEIVLAVAIGSDARIKGVRVLQHKEDAPYFKRLKDAFFDQFLNQRADGRQVQVDAVTRATLSSRAIIREVLEGSQAVVALPEVAGKVSKAEQCSLTAPPVVSHN
jgi:hypothetical protein